MNKLSSNSYENGLKVYDTNIKINTSTVKGGLFKHRDKFHNSVITGDFDCKRLDSLISLEKSPTKIKGSFDCRCCYNLISLQGAPRYIGLSFVIGCCYSLKSLNGAPTYVGMDVDMGQCQSLTSLTGIGQDYLQEIRGTLFVTGSIRSHMLGILKIENLKFVKYKGQNETMKKVVNILNSHLTSGRRLSKCREELIEAGFKEFARL
jgi:hypothetical protein